MTKEDIIIVAILLVLCLVLAVFFILEYDNINKIGSSISLTFICLLYILLYRKELQSIIKGECKIIFFKNIYLLIPGLLLVVIKNYDVNIGFVIPKIILGVMMIITSLVEIPLKKEKS